MLSGSGDVYSDNTTFFYPPGLKSIKLKLGSVELEQYDHTDDTDFDMIKSYLNVPAQFAGVDFDEVDLISSRGVNTDKRPPWGLAMHRSKRFIETFSLRKIAAYLIGSLNTNIAIELSFSHPLAYPVACLVWTEQPGCLSFIHSPLAVVNSIVE